MTGIRSRANCVTNIFRVLNDQNITYAVLRNYEKLPMHVGKDIDVLVDPEQICKFLRILIESSEACCYFIARMKWNMRGVMVQIEPANTIVDCKKNQSGFVIHAVIFIPFKLGRIGNHIKGFSRKVFISDVGVRRFTQQGFCIDVLDEKSELVTLYAQFQRKRKTKYADRLLNILENKDIFAWVRQATNTDRGLILSVSGDDSKIKQQVDLLVNAIWPSKGLVFVLKSYFQVGLAFLRSYFIRIAPIVYFSGPDGSGKTTNLFRLSEFMQSMGMKFVYFRTHQVILASIVFVLKGFRRIFVSDSGSSEQGPFVQHSIGRDRDTGRILWRLRRLAGLLFGIIEIIPGFGIAYLLSRFGYTVVIEASPFDMFVKRHRPRFPVLEKNVVPLIPRANIGFIMKAEPKVIVERKPELTEAEVSDYYNRMQDMLANSRNNDVFVWVDTNDWPEKSSRHIAQSLLHEKNKRIYNTCRLVL